MNHLHLADIQAAETGDISSDKLLAIGNTLKEILEAKLQWQFPERPCVVEFYVPEDEEDYLEDQISFWQLEHE